MIFLKHYFQKYRLSLYINLGISYIFRSSSPNNPKEIIMNVSVVNLKDKKLNIILDKVVRNNCYFILGNIFKKEKIYYNFIIESDIDDINIINKYVNQDYVFSRLPYISNDNELAKIYLVNTFIKYLKKKNDKENNI